MEPKDKKGYELAFVVKDENVPAEIAGIVRQAGGEITREANPARLHLAYKINKESEGIFGYMQFMLDPEALKAISDTLNLRPGVLRFLVIALPKKSVRMGEAREPHPVRPAEPRSASLSNQDLEKKIEEILQ